MMNRIIRNKMVVGLASLCLLLMITTYSSAQDDAGLSTRQENIVVISALTATGNIDALKQTLNASLDAGMTVNEIEEVIVHAYAYAGFPRSFTGMMAFMAVMEQRQAKGIKDEVGREASPVPADLNRDEYGAKVRAQLSGLAEVPPPAKWQQFSPVIDKFLKEHLFADLFARDILSFSDRELATVAILASIPVEGPLPFHLGAAMNTGLTKQQLQEFIAVLAEKVDKDKAENANKILKKVLQQRKS
jgi:alkylhydroperoxidase/carboxymuconolactone decarboxylase family protein YurZ